MRVKVPHEHLEQRVNERGSAYRAMLAPAIVEKGEGFFVVETDHPSYRALEQKYRPRPGQVTNGPELWAELHASKITPEFLMAFARKIPCGECKAHWVKWVKENPPDLSSEESAFAWGVRGHNVVSEKIGKRVWTIAEARARWRKSPAPATGLRPNSLPKSSR